MPPTIQDTLLDLFDQVRQDPDALPSVPVKDWEEGSVEWSLLSGFHAMLEQVQQRMHQFRQMEQQFREKEEQYRAIFEATIDGLSINDLEDGRVIVANPALCEMFGYTYEEFIDLPPTATIHPDTFHVVADVLQKVQSGTPFQTRFVGLRKDGTSFHAEGRGTPFIYKGRPHLLGSTRDITEQVRAEQELREKEEQYRSVFEATDDGLNIADLDGFYVEANPAYCRMLGYTREELMGMHYSQSTFPEYYPVLEESAQAIESGSQYQTQGLARRKDGSPLPVEAHATPFIYKGKPHILGVMRDITERVDTDRQLREKEEQYRSIFEAVTDSLTISSLEDGRVVEANPATCKMIGYGYEELIGKVPAELVPPDYLPVVADGLQTLRAGGRNDVMMLTLRKDGTSFPTEVHSTLFNYKGKPHLLTVSRDITERVEAEKQLREREEQYRGVFEATYDALCIMNLDGFLVEVNPAFCKMFGYPHAEVIGLHASTLTGPVSLPSLSDALKTLKTGRGTQTELGQGLRKNGTVFYTESQSNTFTYQGEPHALGVIRDITERVEAEQQLREREEQYRSVFEASTDGLFIQELEDGRVIEVNPAACEMHGFTREEFIGLLPTSFIHPDSFTLVSESLQTIQGGGQYHARGLAKRKDGTPFNAEAHVTTFTYKGRPHLLSIVRDITEQIQAEEQLREKEKQYRSIFEASYDGVCIYDMDGFLVEVNPAFCSMFGYIREELIGLRVSIIIPLERHHYVDNALESLKDGGEYQALVKCVRKDGTQFYAETHSTTFTYRGNPHALGVMRDTTEQVQAKKLLEQRVEERTRELSSLLEISHTVASTLYLNPLLGLILDQLKTVIDYSGAAIMTVEGKDLIVLDNRSPIQEVQHMQLRFPLKDLGLIWETMISRETIIMPDVRNDTHLARAFRAALGELGQTTFRYVRACMVVPLSLKEQVIGMLVLTSNKEEAFTPRHSTLALAIANQAAVAIENARLYEQAQALAAIEERQRLARELHDSVSQALYGISLGVHTARMQLDRNPKDLVESLDYVLELADAALIEMRALIFELRPESLETEGLVTALTKQAAALHARQGIIVQLELGKEPDVPLKVKQDLFRIAQEALHNTVKHARASQVELRMDQAGGLVTVEVCDNGKGFDTTTSFPGHLGLHSMRERVKSLGGELMIESAPGQGTCINAQVPIHTATNNTGSLTA